MKITTKDRLIKFLFKYGNTISNKNINEILQIDNNIDFNLFDLTKTKFDVLYNTNQDNISNINSNNSRTTSISYPFVYKIKGDDTLRKDMSYFFKNLEKIVYIEELNKTKMYDWSSANRSYQEIKRFYYIKYLNIKSTKNLKGFRFILHSTTTKATNIFNHNKYNKSTEYYIKAKQIDETIFKKNLRKKKLTSVI